MPGTNPTPFGQIQFKTTQESYCSSATYAALSAAGTPVPAGVIVIDDSVSPNVVSGISNGVGGFWSPGVAGAANRPATLLLFGDSIAFQQFDSSAGGFVDNYSAARGSLNHFNALMGSPFRILGQAGVSGTTSGPWNYDSTNFTSANLPVDWLSRVQAAAVQAAGGWVWIGYPENDQTFGVPPATTIANLKLIYGVYQSYGVNVIQADGLADARPVNVNAAPGTTVATMQNHFNIVMAWIKANARQYGIYLYEQYAPTATVGTGALIAGYTFDSMIHPSSLGAGAIAGYNSIKNVIPKLPLYEYQTYPNWRNGFAAGDLTGTGGTATGFTGTAPDGIVFFKSGSPGTPVASAVARTDGRNGSYLALTATAGAQGDRVGFNSVIDLATPFSAKAWTKFQRVLGSYGDHWVVTTAGTATGTEPIAMAAASVLGQTCTDLSTNVTFTRVDTIRAGDQYEVIVTFQIVGCSSLSLGVMPAILINLTGTGALGGGRALNWLNTDSLPTCYSQTSATPRTQDMALRSPVTSHNSLTTGLTVFFYMWMANTLQATLLVQSVELSKIVTP